MASKKHEKLICEYDLPTYVEFALIWTAKYSKTYIYFHWIEFGPLGTNFNEIMQPMAFRRLTSLF